MQKLQYILIAALLLLTQGVAFAQSENLMRGIVLDDMDEPVIGANIREVDAQNRVMSVASTDINGEFSLILKNKKNKVVFSYVGCKPVTIDYAPEVTVKLDPVSSLQEVVVTAQKMTNDGGMPIPVREISGAVQTINTKAFEGVSVSSVDDALQGRMAGLDIVNASGDLGSGSSMRIRGTGTISSHATPLIVLNDIH